MLITSSLSPAIFLAISHSGKIVAATLGPDSVAEGPFEQPWSRPSKTGGLNARRLPFADAAPHFVSELFESLAAHHAAGVLFAQLDAGLVECVYII